MQLRKHVLLARMVFDKQLWHHTSNRLPSHSVSSEIIVTSRIHFYSSKVKQYRMHNVVYSLSYPTFCWIYEYCMEERMKSKNAVENEVNDDIICETGLCVTGFVIEL